MKDSPGPARYVYCIVETEERLDLGPLGIGTEGRPVYTVHHGSLAAVVSETPLGRCAPTRENLLAHEIVNERVLRDRTAIPVSFGTILRTDRDVVALLSGTGTVLTDTLAALRGTVELGLSVTWYREKAVTELEAGDPALRVLKKEIESGASSSTDQARARLGQIVEEAIESRAVELTESVYEPLRALSVGSRRRNLIGDDMILNWAFLVERAQEEEFDRTVGLIRSRYDGLLTFLYTGPWLPYSFVRMRVKLGSAAQTKGSTSR